MVNTKLKISLSFWEPTWQNNYPLMANLNATGIVLNQAQILQHRVIVADVSLRKEWSENLQKNMENEIKACYSNIEQVQIIKID